MASNSIFLTVATVNYVPQALAMFRSARRHEPQFTFHLFAIDATEDGIAGLRAALEKDYSWVRVFGPYDLGPERGLFLNAFKYYNSVEMCCLAKYVGVSHVTARAEAGEYCVFADADMLVFSEISQCFEEMGPNAMYLTPHQFGPGSDDAEHDYLLHGWINAGFFILRRTHPGARGVLDWLINRISRRGYFAPGYGLSCDQTWLSALPFLFRSVTIVSRHPGVNVAYWNLFERPLTQSDGELRVSGDPLVAFHFSGFDPSNGARLSKHSDVSVCPGSALDEVCQRYRTELDTTDTLASQLTGLKKLQSTNAPLEDRMYCGSELNNLNLASPTRKLGRFSKLGMKVDYLLRRVTR